MAKNDGDFLPKTGDLEPMGLPAGTLFNAYCNYYTITIMPGVFETRMAHSAAIEAVICVNKRLLLVIPDLTELFLQESRLYKDDQNVN